MSLHQEKQELAACLNRLKSKSVSTVLRDPDFVRFHKERNKFNDYQVTKLIEQPPYSPVSPTFKDNLGRIWKEETIGVKYHVTDWGDALKKWGREKKNRYSRKFLMQAPLPGYAGAEFEMIVKRNSSRIIAGDLMETYNFGASGARSSFGGVSAFGYQMVDAGLHHKFDIAPHLELGGASAYRSFSAGPVRIIDLLDLYDNGDVDLKDLVLGR